MANQIERDGARKMSGEDQMMFQDHVPFVDKVRNGDWRCLPILETIDENAEESSLRRGVLEIQSALLLCSGWSNIPYSPLSRTVI